MSMQDQADRETKLQLSQSAAEEHKSQQVSKGSETSTMHAHMCAHDHCGTRGRTPS